jgi:CopG family transcriptional regulator / antitoxin EndoAI
MRETLTISLTGRMRKEIGRAARQEGVSRSEFVRNAVKSALFRRSLEAAREELVPRARRKGIYTDEDVFRLIS